MERASKPLRILHLLTQKPDFTGSGIYLRALLKEAKKLDHQTAVVYGRAEGEEFELPNSFPVDFETENLPFPVIGMSDVMPYPSSQWSKLTPEQLQLYEQSFKSTLERAIGEFQPDLIHSHHLWLLTSLARRAFPQKVVVASSHGTGLRQMKTCPQFAEGLQQGLKDVNHAFFLTQAQAQSAPFVSDYSVVGAGYNQEIFRDDEASQLKRRRVLYAGKLSRSKGCFELLSALDTLENVETAFAGSGHGEEAEKVQAIARKLGVQLLGRIKQNELAKEMGQSDVFVLPSYFEGLPLVLAEALACGCKLVVSDLPGLADWFGPDLLASGWVQLVKLPERVGADRISDSDVPDFVDNLSKAIRLQLESRPESSTVLESFLRDKSWSGVYQKIHQVYETLV